MRTHTGFTLTELSAVVAIVGILTAIGVPSFRYVTVSNRVSAEVNGLLGDLQFARGEAIKEGQPVSICISSDSATCLTSGSGWNNGWIVFSDPNGNGTVDTGETVLRVQQTFSNTDSFSADNSVSALTFNREGFLTNLGTANVTITLHDSTHNTSYTRCLYITALGLLTTQTATGPSSASNCT